MLLLILDSLHRHHGKRKGPIRATDAVHGNYLSREVGTLGGDEVTLQLEQAPFRPWRGDRCFPGFLRITGRHRSQGERRPGQFHVAPGLSPDRRGPASRFQRFRTYDGADGDFSAKVPSSMQDPESKATGGWGMCNHRPHHVVLPWSFQPSTRGPEPVDKETLGNLPVPERVVSDRAGGRQSYAKVGEIPSDRHDRPLCFRDNHVLGFGQSSQSSQTCLATQASHQRTSNLPKYSQQHAWTWHALTIGAW
jgi:hypothetical protein